MMREVADGNLSPQEAVRAYHGELQKQRLKPQRPLDEDDMAITEAVLRQLTALSRGSAIEAQMAANFASDNTAPVAPEVMAAILAANRGPAASYGADELDRAAAALAREVFETEVEIFPVSTGTAANGLALASIAPALRCDLLPRDRAHPARGVRRARSSTPAAPS